MRFLLMHRSIVGRDAIGADIVGMYDALRSRFQCHLYGEYVEISGRSVLGRDESARVLSEPENIVIYHHSAYWEEGEALLRQTRARIIIKYHNITPPSFFVDFEMYWDSCLKGREQTYRLVALFPEALWLSDSHCNFAEIGIDGLPASTVAPPFLSPITAARICPDEELLKSLIESKRTHVFMIGRFVPNKGHRLFLNILRVYSDLYTDPIVGIIAGKLDPMCRSYYDAVMADAHDLGVADRLVYADCVSDAELLSYYLGCDAYLCCSYHEGFCVPVVESQCVHLPVVARRSCALTETLGPGQILLDDDPVEYATAIDKLRKDQNFWFEITDQGYNNYRERFTPERIHATFTQALEGFLGIQL